MAKPGTGQGARTARIIEEPPAHSYLLRLCRADLSLVSQNPMSGLPADGC